MIGNDQQLRRICEREIVREHLRFHVPVHTDKMQLLRLAIDLPGNAALLCRKRESPVRVELEGRHRQLLHDFEKTLSETLSWSSLSSQEAHRSLLRWSVPRRGPVTCTSAGSSNNPSWYGSRSRWMLTTPKAAEGTSGPAGLLSSARPCFLS